MLEQIALATGAVAVGAAIVGFGVVIMRKPRSAPEVDLEVLEESPVTFVPPAPPAPAPAAAPPPPSHPRAHPEKAPAMVLTQGARLVDDSFERRVGGPAYAPPRPAERPPMRGPPPSKSWAQQTLEELPPPVQTEWARRQVGPLEPGRTSGVCSGCGARLSVSTQRPLRIACPVCGRSKLLA